MAYQVVKVAKRYCDSVELALVASGFAADYAHIKIERKGKNKFEVRAWERITP
jgi:hypothetical protein